MKAEYAQIEIKCPRCKKVIKVIYPKDRANGRTVE